MVERLASCYMIDSQPNRRPVSDKIDPLGRRPVNDSQLIQMESQKARQVEVEKVNVQFREPANADKWPLGGAL